MSEHRMIDFIKEKNRLLDGQAHAEASDGGIRPTALALRDYHAPEELKRRTLEAMEKRSEEKRERQRRRNRNVKRMIATAAIIAILLAATPLGGMVVSAAEELFGKFFGTYVSREVEAKGNCYTEFVPVDYHNGKAAVMVKIGDLDQYVNIGDFEFEFGDVMVCEDVGIDGNTEDYWPDGRNPASSYDVILGSHFLMPVRVTHQGSKRIYGGYMPGFELDITVAGYKDGEKAVEFELRNDGLYSEEGNEIYPVRSGGDYATFAYPTHFINGKPTPKNSFLFKYNSMDFSYINLDLLMEHYKAFVEADEQMRDYIWGNNDWYPEEKKQREKELAALDHLSEKELQEIRRSLEEYAPSGISPFEAVMAIQPDKYVVTSLSLCAEKPSGFSVSEESDPETTTTGYGIYKERFYVNWKNTQFVWYYIVNQDYEQEWKNAEFMEEYGEPKAWEPVPFYDIDDSSGRKR